jgi:tRNA modification GTPase
MVVSRERPPRPTRDEEPIAALASGTGAAAVALLRLSGRGCHEFVAPLLEPLGSASWAAQTLRLCRLRDGETGEILDEPLAAQFFAPRSFTGEDSVEIYCHGGPFIVQRALASLYRAGFRPAEPGEFTRRAFLNGKLDLTAAEGIKELVEAQSHQQWQAARQLASGKLKETIDALRKELIQSMAYLEAQIDFPDEGDTAHLHRGHVRTRVEAVRARVKRLLSTYDSGRVASRGLMVALVGAPNAGKSTLMNELLGRERAIVTPIAGTTRDYLEESCLVNGRLIRLVDMAGLRESRDAVEAIGIETARRLARAADLVVFLAASDAAAAATEVDAWERELTPQKALHLATKSDLAQPAWAKGPRWLAVSCATGAGVDALRARLAEAVDRHVGGLGEESFVTSARHVAALEATQVALDAFAAADARGEYDELLAFELQQAARALQAIVGAVDNEDVLDAVFSTFCVGK